MKIKIIALSLMSLCASQAFGNTVNIQNNTSNSYNVTMLNAFGDNNTKNSAVNKNFSYNQSECITGIVFTRDSDGNYWGWQKPNDKSCGNWNLTINAFNDVTVDGVQYAPKQPSSDGTQNALLPNQPSKAVIDQKANAAEIFFVK